MSHCAYADAKGYALDSQCGKEKSTALADSVLAGHWRDYKQLLDTNAELRRQAKQIEAQIGELCMEAGSI